MDAGYSSIKSLLKLVSSRTNGQLSSENELQPSNKPSFKSIFKLKQLPYVWMWVKITNFFYEYVDKIKQNINNNKCIVIKKWCR